MFKSLLILGLLGGVYACPVVMQGDECHQVVNNRFMPKLASYDDEEYTITLSANELNNYTWNNFYQTLDDLVTTYDTSFNDYLLNVLYSTHTYAYSSDDTYYLLYQYENSGTDYNFYIVTDSVEFNTEHVTQYSNYQFAINNSDDGFFEFDDNLVLNIVNNSTHYSAIKQAIELDIQANSGFSPQDVMTNIVTILVSGITGIATGIGQGVSTLVSNIFLSSGNHLSVFGGVLMVFAGIALAIGLCRWVMNLLTSLGAKK